MNILEFARNRAFWLIDALKGGKVREALDILKNVEDGVWDETHIQDYQSRCLEKLLLHAKKTVPFYSNQKDTILEHWPVVNKNVLRENKEIVLSSIFNKNQLIRMSTSGSTGTPFVSWQNIEKKRHVNAETLYYNGKIGFQIGRRIIYLRSIVTEVQKSNFQQFAQNIYLLDCNDLSDKGIKEKLRFIVQYSKDCGAMLMGYASTLTAFQKYFDKYGYEEVKEANIYGVVSGSEILYDNTRNIIEKAFQCKCVSRYANEENGFLGQDGIINNVFYMNRANYYFEILKMDSDTPADDGEIGRIVVTDLYNWAMPMIRYDTGDVGAFNKNTSNNKFAIGSFGGRVVDSIENCEGELVSPHAITNLMWEYKSVKQFQFVQKNVGHYRIILNVGNERIDEIELKNKFLKILGELACVEFEYTNDIPVLASGKRRYIVNECRGKNSNDNLRRFSLS